MSQTLRLVGNAFQPVVLASLLLMPIEARAEGADGARGVLDAVGSRSVAPGSAIAVVAQEDTALNHDLRAKIERGLAERGYRVDEGAPLVLRFNGSVGFAADRQPAFGLRGQVTGDSRSAVLAERRFELGGPLSKGDRSQYSVRLTLGESGRPPAWQGSATALLAPTDAAQVTGRMAAVLLDHLGATARNVSFPID